jgi:hypothetical protein
MKHILITILLILGATAVSAETKEQKLQRLLDESDNNKRLPTPYELITKGTVIHKYTVDDGDPVYYIVWDKTDDLYSCRLRFNIAKCVLMAQGTEAPQ